MAPSILSFDIPQIGDATAPISDPSAADQENPEVDLSTPGTNFDSEVDAGLQQGETEGDGRSSQSLTAMTGSTGEEEVLEQRVPTRKDPQVDKATGAFTYSVPITVPAFRGLEPKLAFTYSSSGLLRGRPDSYSGLNWKLSGLSVIERRSIGGGIATFDDDLDIYMLDGMPLLACKSGQRDASAPPFQIISNYPADYKATTTSASCLAGGNLTSKREDYRKIERVPATSVNTVGNTGPNGETLYNFKVYDKDGTVYLYKSIGELANMSGESGAMPWTSTRFNSVFYRRYVLTEVYDSQRFSSGPNYPNRVSYIYGFSSLPNGLAERPVEIRYAGNDAGNNGGYRILFGYDTTTLPLSTFGVGNETMFGSQNRLLRSIRVMRDSSTIRAYKIEYVNGTLIPNTWLPSSITELGGLISFDGTTGKVASNGGNVEMPPVTFKYNNDVPQVERVLHSNGTNVDYQFTSYPSFFDFDGDGRSEVAFIESLGNVDSKYPDASSHVLHLDPLAQNEPKLSRYSQINIDYEDQPDAYVLGFTSEKRSLNGLARYFLWGPTWGPPLGCHPFLIRRKLDGSASGAFDGPGDCARPAIVAELDGDLDPEALVEGDPYYLNLSSANVDPIAKVPLPFSVDWKDRLTGDFNENGLTDAWLYDSSPTNSNGSVDFIMYSSVDSKRRRQVANPQYVAESSSNLHDGPAGRRLASDVNGDGLDDLINVQQISGNSVQIKVRLSNGYSFQPEQTWWSGVLGTGETFGYLKDHTMAADVNSDGLADLVISLGSYSTSDATKRGFVFINTGFDNSGNGFIRQEGMDLIAFIGGGDLNGDGTIDLVGLGENGEGTDRKLEVVYSKDSDSDGHAVTLANVLTEVKTELGAKISVQYAPTSQGIAAETVVTDDLIPGVRQVVKSLTVDDGRGGSAVTEFRYAGGRWSEEHRESLGYTTVTEILPSDPGDGGQLTRTTTFDTLNYNNGGAVLSETLELDPAGTAPNTLLSRTLNSWTSAGSGMGPFFTLLTSSRSATWQSASETALLETKSEMAYTPYGEVAISTDYGFVSHGNGSDFTVKDNVVSITEYVTNLSGYIVNKPSHTRVEKVDPALSGQALWLSAQYFRYDGQAQGAAPTKGNLTWVGQWSNTATPRPMRAMTYDQFGNVLTETDANNLALPAGSQLSTTHTYGGSRELFRLTTRSPINPLNQTTPSLSPTADEKIVWNEKCQAPDSVANQNNQITTYTYDSLCRETQKTFPGGE